MAIWDYKFHTIRLIIQCKSKLYFLKPFETEWQAIPVKGLSIWVKDIKPIRSKSVIGVFWGLRVN